MRWYERIASIDRRIIYIILSVLVIIPFFIPFSMKQNIMPQTQRLYDFIDSLAPDDKAVILSLDYTPQTMPETHPMAIAILTHCFARNIPVIGMSFDPQAPGLAIDAFATVVDNMNRNARTREDSLIYGEDYVYLGWKSGRVAAEIQMGESIADVFPRDHLQNSIDSLPLMQRVKNYKQVSIAIVIAGADYPQDWILYPQARYGVRVGAGLTAVMSPKYYPFLQTGQLSGLLSGMKGAAEYETLLLKNGYAKELGRAETGMNSQSLIHILIIIFIILGNIGFLFSRRGKK